LRGDVPHAEEGDLVRGSARARPPGKDRDREAAACGPRTLHRLRHLRNKMPGARQARDLCHECRREQVEGQSVAVVML